MKPISVLVVDDSAFIRNVLSSIINEDSELTVIGAASDGREAVEKAEELRPDVITLDIKMPKMDGLEALKIIMERCPTAVIMVSSLTEEGAHATLDALSKGAVDFIAKGMGDSPKSVIELQTMLLEKIKAVGRLDKNKIRVRKRKKEVVLMPKLKKIINQAEMVAIGSSTGGPRALQDMLPDLPADFPVAGVIVQHMPAAFLGPFAERINKICRITVKIAENGEPLTPGTFLIGPGGKHLTLNRRGKRNATVHLSPEPSDSLHRPSVNQIFLSVAETYPSTGLGVIMTGMGSDGLEGARAMKKANCGIIAQNAASCVVYGMPRVVVDENLADMVAPLDQLHSIILSAVQR